MKLNFLISITLIYAFSLSGCNTDAKTTLSVSSSGMQFNIDASRDSAQLTRLGWDTEGTGRDTINLLKSPVRLSLSKENEELSPEVRSEIIDDQTIRFKFFLKKKHHLTWEIALKAGEMNMRLSGNDDMSGVVDKVELLLPFNPKKALTSVIGSNWTVDGKFRLPVIISAPDIGQLLVTSNGNQTILGYTKGSRGKGMISVKLEIPVPAQNSSINLKFTPVILSLPKNYTNEKRWVAARRGWFNLIQQSCGASGGGKEVVGVWANNVLSDPVSSLLYILGDATLLVPELAPGVTMPPILRRSIEYFIDQKTTNYGMVGYTAGGTPAAEGDLGDPDPNDKQYKPGKHQTVMDSNPSVIIGAWSYVKATSDTVWLKNRIKDLEFIAQYMVKRDIDNDGLVESRQSGNSGSRLHRNPDMAWDCYSAGHKNSYINILVYRALKYIADLENILGDSNQEKNYLKHAEKLKVSFSKSFYNPETGWLGWWRSSDGKLHDIYSDIPTSLAIAYGLVEKDEGRKMLQRYWAALEATGFNRFDLGMPVCLRPVPREEMEHYTDFQQFLNGGCCVINTAYTIDALFQVGMEQEGNMILDAMLKRQREGVFPNGGGFQNGFVDKMGFGAEVFDWNGGTAGYEGHLVYCWNFLHSMLRSDR